MKLRLGDTSQSQVQSGFQYLKGWRFHDFYGHPIAVFCHQPFDKQSPVLGLRLIPGKQFESSNPVSYLLSLSAYFSHFVYTDSMENSIENWTWNMTAWAHPVSVQIQLREKILGTLAFFLSFISRSLAMLSCTLSSSSFFTIDAFTEAFHATFHISW